jgi:hypothetical protein
MSSRSALVVANDAYEDPGLSRLRAPAVDAAELASVLSDPAIGDFAVKVVSDQPEHRLRREIARFFADRSRDDLLLLHFSCHGIKDESGQLYFATTDTELSNLDATAVSAEYVNRQMTRSRSRRMVLLLDCCYSGAFARGMLARADSSVDLVERFEGRGRTVLTASSALEYAFEDAELSRAAARPSVFTHAVVTGLRTGEADRDGDGRISVDELYEYVYDEVRRVTPNQNPGRWNFEAQGDLFIARSPSVRTLTLPAELRQAVENPVAAVRLETVSELERLLTGAHPGRARAARRTLDELAADDSQRVSTAARQALASLSTERLEPARPPVPTPEAAAASAGWDADAAPEAPAAERATAPAAPVPTPSPAGIRPPAPNAASVREPAPPPDLPAAVVGHPEPPALNVRTRAPATAPAKAPTPVRAPAEVQGAAPARGTARLAGAGRVGKGPATARRQGLLRSVPRSVLVLVSAVLAALAGVVAVRAASGRSTTVAVGEQFSTTSPWRLAVSGRGCTVSVVSQGSEVTTATGADYVLQLRRSGTFSVERLGRGCRAAVLPGSGEQARRSFQVAAGAPGAGGDTTPFWSSGSFQITTTGTGCSTAVHDSRNGELVQRFDGNGTRDVPRGGEFYVRTSASCSTSVELD